MNKSFNDRLGEKLSLGLSTMGMFYIIAFLVIVPLFFVAPVGLVAWIQYTVAVFFQGTALPVLGYVARMSGEKQEKILNETHDTVMEELMLIKEEVLIMKEEREIHKKMLEELLLLQTTRLEK